MGIWGTGLYENDLTLDVKNTYTRYLKLGLSDEEAYNKTHEEYSMLDQYFWVAIADTMWKYGRLTKEVKTKAVMCITDGSKRIPEFYSDIQTATKWEKTLNNLKERLETEMPLKKKFSKYKIVTPDDTDFWNIGDVYAYHIFNNSIGHTEESGKYIVMQKIATTKDGGFPVSIEEDMGFTAPVVVIFNKLFNFLPKLNDLMDLSYCGSPLNEYENRKQPKYLEAKDVCFVLSYYPPFPDDKLHFIGNKEYPQFSSVIYCGKTFSRFFFDRLSQITLTGSKKQGLPDKLFERICQIYENKSYQISDPLPSEMNMEMDCSDLKIGDVFSCKMQMYRRKNYGRPFYTVMVKVGEWVKPISKIYHDCVYKNTIIEPVFLVFNKLFADKPNLKDVIGLQFMPNKSSVKVIFDWKVKEKPSVIEVDRDSYFCFANEHPWKSNVSFLTHIDINPFINSSCSKDSADNSIGFAGIVDVLKQLSKHRVLIKTKDEEDNRKQRDDIDDVIDKINFKTDTIICSNDSQPKVGDGNFWKAGDVYAYQFSSEKSKAKHLFGRYILMQKIGEVTEPDHDFIDSLIVIYDKTYSSIPDADVIYKSRPLMMNISTSDLDEANTRVVLDRQDFYTEYFVARTMVISGSDFPSEGYTFLKNLPVHDPRSNGDHYYDVPIFTLPLEDVLIEAYEKWHNIEYSDYYSFDNCVERSRNGSNRGLRLIWSSKFELLSKSDKPTERELYKELVELANSRSDFIDILSSSDLKDQELINRIFDALRNNKP